MLKKTLVLALLAVSSASFAGNWQVKVGGSVVAPSADDSTLNTKQQLGTDLHNVKAEHAASFTPSIEYFFNDTGISTELLLATPIKHDVSSTETGGTFASFKHLPPTLTVKYNFQNSTGFTPYIGAGATAVITFQEKVDVDGANLKASNAYGPAGQVGFTFAPADAKNWSVFFDTRYAHVKSKLKLDAGDGNGYQKIGDLKVNPWVYTAGFAYRF